MNPVQLLHRFALRSLYCGVLAGCGSEAPGALLTSDEGNPIPPGMGGSPSAAPSPPSFTPSAGGQSAPSPTVSGGAGPDGSVPPFGGSTASGGGTSEGSDGGTGGTGSGGTANGGSSHEAGAGGADLGQGGADPGQGGNNAGQGGSDSGQGGTDTGQGGTPGNPPPAFDPIYRIEMRVHRGQSALDDLELEAILSETTRIWFEQAGICFEIHTVDHDEPMDSGFDFWFTVAGGIPDGANLNGVYRGPHNIWSIDNPRQGEAPNPADSTAARTAAHELGHALNLRHQNPDREGNCLFDGDECNDLLMRSGRKGFALATGSPANTNEVETARERAPRFALEDTSLSGCSPPQVN